MILNIKYISDIRLWSDQKSNIVQAHLSSLNFQLQDPSILRQEKKKNFQENSGPSTRSGSDNSDLTRGVGWFLLIPVNDLVVLEVLLDKLLSSVVVGEDGHYLAK